MIILDHITEDTQPGSSTDALIYDRNGNRTQLTDGQTSTNYSYLTNSVVDRVRHD